MKVFSKLVASLPHLPPFKGRGWREAPGEGSLTLGSYTPHLCLRDIFSPSKGRSGFVIAVALCLAPLPAFAQTSQTLLVLKSQVTDGDGRITLGDVFDNAGAASDVLLGYRQGTTAVLDAGIVQTIAARNGVYWDNPRGLRRIIVAQGQDGAPLLATIDPNAPQTPQTSGFQRTLPIAQPAAIRRAETVAVTWQQNGLSLTLSGVAQKDGAIGDQIQIQNPSSKKLIDAVVTGPGQALAGPAAAQMRAQLLSSR